jgi:hypothetical protein
MSSWKERDVVVAANCACLETEAAPRLNSGRWTIADQVKSSKRNRSDSMLEHFLIEKVGQLFRNML